MRAQLGASGPIVLLVEILESSLRGQEEELRDEPAGLLILEGQRY